MPNAEVVKSARLTLVKSGARNRALTIHFFPKRLEPQDHGPGNHAGTLEIAGTAQLSAASPADI